MQWWEALIWGLFGGFSVEALELTGAVRRTGTWPWKSSSEPGALAFGVVVLVRLVISSGLTVAAAESQQIGSAIAAVTTGLAAPLLMEQLARQATIGVIGRPTSHNGEARSSSQELAGHLADPSVAVGQPHDAH